MEYLIAVDLEGVHGVVGEPYQGLGRVSCPEEYQKAVAAATKEVNAAVAALFDSGATKVCVWDNHGGGGNLDFSLIDSRAQQVKPDNSRPRMEFLSEHDFKGLVYIGYHCKDGTINGVLAHTFSSVNMQYYKINGQAKGELDFDTCIAGSYGVPAIFAASDDLCDQQMQECNPDTVTVITKYAKGRNKADFRDSDEVVRDIYEGVKRAVKANIQPITTNAPL